MPPNACRCARLRGVLPPVVVLELPAEAQSIIAGYVAAVGLMLMIHWRVNDSRKHD
jgi:hypothetical protein